MAGFDRERWGRSFHPLWVPENLSLLGAGADRADRRIIMAGARTAAGSMVMFASPVLGALGMLAVSCLINFIIQPYFSLISLIAKMTMGGGEREFGPLGAAVVFSGRDCLTSDRGNRLGQKKHPEYRSPRRYLTALFLHATIDRSDKTP